MHCIASPAVAEIEMRHNYQQKSPVRVAATTPMHLVYYKFAVD